MGEYFVHSEQMTVGYDGKPLIRDIEIRLNRGEILTLIGPNGAGKSTILKSLTRQLKLVGETDESDVRQGSRTEAGRCNDGENKTRAYDM